MSADYFSLFGLPVAFEVDLQALEKAYFTAQRTFHPDRLAGKAGAEKQQAILQSMRVNDGYEILKSPLRRAQHMLALRGITVGSEKDSVKPSQALLMESLEAREALAEVEDMAGVQMLEAQNQAHIAELIAELGRAFAGGQYEEAAQLALRLGYLQKLEQEIKVRKKGF